MHQSDQRSSPQIALTTPNSWPSPNQATTWQQGAPKKEHTYVTYSCIYRPHTSYKCSIDFNDPCIRCISCICLLSLFFRSSFFPMSKGLAAEGKGAFSLATNPHVTQHAVVPCHSICHQVTPWCFDIKASAAGEKQWPRPPRQRVTSSKMQNCIFWFRLCPKEAARTCRGRSPKQQSWKAYQHITCPFVSSKAKQGMQNDANVLCRGGSAKPRIDKALFSKNSATNAFHGTVAR